MWNIIALLNVLLHNLKNLYVEKEKKRKEK